MIDCKLKVMHNEDDKINFYPMRQNGRVYPREENNMGDNSSIFLPYEWNLCDTIIVENTDLRSNNIPESIDSVIYYLHIFGTTYSIQSSKIETATNITIHKMT